MSLMFAKRVHFVPIKYSFEPFIVYTFNINIPSIEANFVQMYNVHIEYCVTFLWPYLKYFLYAWSSAYNILQQCLYFIILIECWNKLAKSFFLKRPLIFNNVYVGTRDKHFPLVALYDCLFCSEYVYCHNGAREWSTVEGNNYIFVRHIIITITIESRFRGYV